MERMDRLRELWENGRMRWQNAERAWVACPDEVMTALTDEGFQECKREITTSRRDRVPTGGVWQGLNTATGSVASAVWLARPPGRDAVIFIDIDGEAVGEGRSA